MSEETDIPRNEEAGLDIAPNTQISAAIDKILANPELISMVASVLGGTSSAKADTVSNTIKRATRFTWKEFLTAICISESLPPTLTEKW